MRCFKVSTPTYHSISVFICTIYILVFLSLNMLTSLFVLFSILIAQIASDNLKLQRVIVFSRHNVRSPLAEHLGDITPKTWPQWNEKSGHLTPKGVYLEGLMGDFFSKWLQSVELFPEACPDENDVFVYANAKQRTKVSARAFAIKAFPGCNITVHVTDKSGIFDPYIHNNTDIFKEKVLDKMQEILGTLHLNSSYELLEDILDYKDSYVCKTDHKCDLETDINTINEIAAGQKPGVTGPLKLSNGAFDAFKMQYYNGFSLSDVAWGLLDNEQSWETLAKISEGYHNVIFNSTIIGRDIALPLIKYMKKIYINKKTKFTLLMGHDANILTLASAMRFKPFILPDQNELAPIGGKIVFQKWIDSSGKCFLKIQYVYASTNQLRLGSKLSLMKPPQFRILELEECPIDSNGFCPWEIFEKFLDEF